MKVVILAGGFGTRLSEYTKIIPKPMIKIGKYPIIVHIMKHYYKFGFKDFYIALGYKGNFIKKYFKNNKFPWNVKLVDTGLKTMTGGRLKRLKKYLLNETFMLTYGDGLSNVDILKLINFHNIIFIIYVRNNFFSYHFWKMSHINFISKTLYFIIYCFII